MASGSSAPTLLVIEDAQDQAILVGVAARRFDPGLRVNIVHDGYVGVSYLAGVTPFDDRRESPLPDLIILDLYMPGADGFAVQNWIRKRPAIATIPVVVLTSSGKPADESRARWLGAAAVYRKPSDLTQLGEVVREIVDAYIPRGAMIDAYMDLGG